MEGLKTGKKSLKTEFFAAVCVTLLLVASVSAVTVFGCWRLRKWLVPDENYVMLSMKLYTQDKIREALSMRFEVDGAEQTVLLMTAAEDGVPVTENYSPQDIRLSIKSVDYGIGRKGPRRKAAYIGAGIAMGVLPAAYSVAGFLFCALWFYRKKLVPPITVLDDAAEHISRQDLDFTVECGSGNELGALCRSFEQMRQALAENNRAMWDLAQERKLILSSVAHDLRNPIAIIQGYAEHLQIRLEAGSLTKQKIRETAGNIEKAAGRLERYTESVRYLNRLEDIALHPVPADALEFTRKLAQDLSILTKGTQVRLETVFGPPLQNAEQSGACTLSLDRDAVYRIAENLVDNALRYARRIVRLTFAVTEDTSGTHARYLMIEVLDDGPGFPETLLKEKIKPFAHVSEPNKHSGLGLAIAQLLCRKHGGRLELSNGGENLPGGALARAFIKT